MTRNSLLLAIALAAFTACADQPTGLISTDVAPDFDRRGGSQDADDDDDDSDDDDGDGRFGRNAIYGVDDANNLVVFSAENPRNARRTPITGVLGSVIGIDFRPNDQNPADNVDNTGLLYAVTTLGGVYTINRRTGVATFRSQLSVAPAGMFFGVGFNPVPDRLRLHSDAEQNLRANVDNGATIVDGPLAYAPGDRNFGRNPDVTGTAYTNSVSPPPTSTALFAIDARQDVLVRLPMPNNGQMVTVGSLGVRTNSYVGFDIPARAERRGFASLTQDGRQSSSLYVVDLETGRSRLVGRIGHPRPLVSIAVNDGPDRDKGDDDDDDNGDDEDDEDEGEK